MAKAIASTVISDGKKILKVWKTNPDFKMGDVTLTKFDAALTALDDGNDDVEIKRNELTALTNTRDEQAAALCEWVTRARSGFRSVYGPDSTQYEQAGGTRKSERKRPVRKNKLAKAA